MPYKALLNNHTPAQLTLDIQNTRCYSKCTEYYSALIANKNEINTFEVKLRTLAPTSEIDLSKIYMRKIKHIQDPKISEFNYKVLHLILPCNMNLFRWGKQESDICDLCGEKEDIPHLIYYCHHAKRVWVKISQAIQKDINLNKIVYGVDIQNETYTISFISYLLYKHWLLKKKECKLRTWTSLQILMIKELNYRAAIFKIIGRNEISMLLTNIEQHFVLGYEYN